MMAKVVEMAMKLQKDFPEIMAGFDMVRHHRSHCWTALAACTDTRFLYCHFTKLTFFLQQFYFASTDS